ncbi:MAG: PEP-utilizing enzyme [Candidatus Woesearchaeota archaeon]
MKHLEELKKVEWMCPVNRKEAPLFSSISTLSFFKFTEAVGWEWDVKIKMTLNKGGIAHDKKDIMILKQKFKDGGVPLLNNFKERLISVIQDFDDYAKSLKKEDFSKYPDEELRKTCKVYFDKALFSHCFLMPMPIADKAVSEMIVNELKSDDIEQKQEWLGILAFPYKENFHTHEQRSFLELVKSHGKDDFEDKLKEHLEKYSWIGARNYYFQYAWKKEDILNRIKSYVEQGKNPDEDINHLNEYMKEKKQEYEKLMEELEIKEGSHLYNLIQLAKEFAYLRTWRTDVVYGAGYKAGNMLIEIEKRANINHGELIYLTVPEVMNAAENWRCPISQEDINERKKHFGSVLYEDEFTSYSNEDDLNLLENLCEKKIQDLDSVKGNIAFKGRIKGKVKVVLEPKDISKVEKGDILVSVMTFPHFITAMEKASAFVTDEGGILCHAAIVAREMKKPCVIGTKVATTIFRDGDIVEVDADKGIVRRI